MCPAVPGGRRPVPALPKVPLPLTPRKQKAGAGRGACRGANYFCCERERERLLPPSPCETAAPSRAGQHSSEPDDVNGVHLPPPRLRNPRSSLTSAGASSLSPGNKSVRCGSLLCPVMEAYSRDLLRGIGRGDEEKPRRLDSQTEEVELSLGLSLGGRFGQERRRGEGLARSASVACIQQVALATPALPRTNSLPAMAEAEAEAGNNPASPRSGAEVQPQGSGVPLNGVVVEPAALPRASLSPPSTDSSDGQGKLRPSLSPPSTGSSDGQGILTRTSSLPAGIEDGWRKRKLAHTLEKLGVKRRIERMNSSNVSGEDIGEKVENGDDLSTKSEQAGGMPKVQRMNHSNVRRRSSGLPPPYQPPAASRRSCLPGNPRRQNSALKGTPGALERSLSSAVLPSSERANSSAVTTSSSSALAVRAASLVISEGEQQDGSERTTARATRSAADMMVRKMPSVYTSGLPNGERIGGFLYQYSRVDEVRIVCVCHGSFLTPAEFVAHAGGGEVAHPMRHIVVNPPSSL